jgi:3-hydroxybutyrate dehydrogenase
MSTMKMTDRIAVVTGAASGIGLHIAQTFAREGAKVCIADLSLEAARAAADGIERGGGSAMAVAMDVADEKAVERGFDEVTGAYGVADVLVSNAGIQHIDAVDKLSFENWRRLIAIHLDGGFLTTRAMLRRLYPTKRGGSVIYMGSVHSHEGSPLKAPYVAAKHGLLGLCKVVAKEGAAHGVRANVICPGFVRTPLVDKQIPEQAKELGISEADVVQKVMLKETVDGEFTTTEEIAQLAVFMATFPGKGLTGQSVVVSHGWHMQ